MAGSLRQVASKPNTLELRVYLGRDAEGRASRARPLTWPDDALS